MIKQQRAVMSYLDALLHEVEPDIAPLETDGKDGNTIDSLSSQSSVVKTVDTIKFVETATENKPHILACGDLENSTETEKPSQVISANTKIMETVGMADSSVACGAYTGPQWASTKFQVISFVMKGIGYVVPMEKLFGIIPMPDSLTLIPGGKSWFLGLHRNRGANLQVIDLAFILNSSNSHSSNVVRQKIDGKFILLLANGRWGFVVDRVDSVLRLENQSVKWRMAQNTSAIVVGTVIENMQIVIDIDVLVENLDRGL